MAFLQETGSGLASANSYSSISFFTTFHTDRGRSLIDPTTSAVYTDAQIQAALVLCSDFLDTKFTFIGYRLNNTQAMEWPRVGAYYRDGRYATGVPVEVEEATVELALKVLQGVELVPDPGFDASLRPVQAETKKVGSILKSTEYAEGGGYIDFKAYPFAEKRLKELVVRGKRLLRV